MDLLGGTPIRFQSW